VNEAAQKEEVKSQNFEQDADGIIAGLEKKNRVLNEKEKSITAALSSTAQKVHKVTIVSRGIGALGFTLQLVTEDSYLKSRTELLEKIDVLLGGRAAQILIFQEATTGAQNDLQKATEFARGMVTLYGMDQARPLHVWKPPSLYLRSPAIFPQEEMCEDTARMIDDDIRSIIELRMDRVLKMLQQHEDLLHGIAARLLEKKPSTETNLWSWFPPRSPKWWLQD
jgi:cell division protease FtsH